MFDSGSDNKSPLWCGNDSPHGEHRRFNAFKDWDYCSGRPARPAGSDNLRDELEKITHEFPMREVERGRYAEVGPNDHYNDGAQVALEWFATRALAEVECRVAEATAPLETKIAAVKSFHFPREMTISGDNKMLLCDYCSRMTGNAYLPSSQWPCATVRALASGQEGS